MINFIFVLVATIFFMLITAAILFTVFRKKIVMNQRLDLYIDSSQEEMEVPLGDGEKLEKVNRSSQLAKKYWNEGVQQVGKRISKEESKKLSLLLRDAGYANKLTAFEFRFIQLLTTVGAALLALLLFLPLVGSSTMLWVLIVAVALLGFRYPTFYLARKKSKRITLIDKDMPDFFDSVNLLIEAGVGIDSALSNVCQRMPGPLSEEFSQTLDAMMRGQSRSESFYELRKRVPSNAFQSVMTSLIQADQLGVGMAKVLRNLTVRVREQRREKAREQAMKAPVKMLFPMVFFIFPSLFIVILGPLVITLITEGLGG